MEDVVIRKQNRQKNQDANKKRMPVTGLSSVIAIRNSIIKRLDKRKDKDK